MNACSTTQRAVCFLEKTIRLATSSYFGEISDQLTAFSKLLHPRDQQAGTEKQSPLHHQAPHSEEEHCASTWPVLFQGMGPRCQSKLPFRYKPHALGFTLRRPGNVQSSTMSPAGVPLPFCGMHAVLLGAGNAEKRVEWFCPEAVVDQPWKQLNRSD